MRFAASGIRGVHVIDLDWHRDERGGFARSFCVDEFSANDARFSVAQMNISWNDKAGTMRGMHYQPAPHAEPKVVRCTQGAIFDVVIDLRPNSSTYCSWFGVELSAENGTALHIPAYMAHGFLTLSDRTEVHYLMGSKYQPGAGAGVRWDDPTFAISWPSTPEVISERDTTYPDYQR